MKYKFHLLGLVHLPVSERYMGCAFTQKIVKLSKMLLSLGHEVYIYGAEGSDAPCTEFIQTHTLSDIRSEWGEGDNRFEIGYDWETKGFKHDFNAEKTKTTQKYYKNAIDAINKRKKADDFLLVMQGTYQRPVDDGVKLFLTMEPGIGYRGSYTRFRAFESAYLQNFTYGSSHPFKSIDGHFYDRVIPNYFDMKDFEFSDQKEDYYFFIGRLIRRKGLWIAHRAVKQLGKTLVVAGQGIESWDGETLKADGMVLSGNIKYVGYVNVEQRKKYLSKAKAVFVPTIYLEAFGGTNVEAQLSGTPVITTNFGVFPETVEHGKTGFLCNTLQDFVDAAKESSKLDYKYIRDRAEKKYSMENVKYDFNKWFDDVYQVYLSTDGKTPGWSFVRTK